MPKDNPRPVVVAVGHEPMEMALRFAAGEAARERCGVHLVHVVHELPEYQVPEGPEFVPVAERKRERLGRQALAAALARARQLVGEAPVTSGLVVGAVAPGIVDAAPDARMIVLEPRDVSRARRIVTRSVVSGVAARARVPVVSVPSGWSPDDNRTAPATVTVGVDVPERSERLLRAAIAAAAARDARLHVLNTWSFPSAFEDLVMFDDDYPYWVERATAQIQTVLDGIAGTAPDVPTRIDAHHAPPADALVEASRESDLLVIGRHDPVVPFGSHVGPVARAVLREAACPVLLAET